MGRVYRRTFEAAQFPKGSDERARLNHDSATSEYMTSYRYSAECGIHKSDFRTKREAEAWLQAMEAK